MSFAALIVSMLSAGADTGHERLVAKELLRQVRLDTEPFCEEGRVGASAGTSKVSDDVVAVQAVIRCRAILHDARVCTQRSITRIAMILNEDQIQYTHDPPGVALRAWTAESPVACGREFDAFTVEGDVPTEIIAAVSEQRQALADDAGLRPLERKDRWPVEHVLLSLMPFFSEPGQGKFCAAYAAAGDSETFVCFKKEGDRLVPFDAQGRP